jgi:hypothetical protein
MIVVATGGNNGRRVVEGRETDKWMAGALDEHGLVNEGTDPGKDEGEKAAEESLDHGREVRKFGGRVRGWEW